MSELITVSKKDPSFISYIEGTFSKELRALPIQSLNVNTEAEQVTFRIFPVREVIPPFLGLHWLQILKVRYLLLVAFPIFLIFVKNWVAGTLNDPITGGLSTLGALCMMTAVNLRNDYLDHLSGLDRLHPQSGSHAIQKGWVTAAQVRTWSYVYLGLGILFGLPSVFLYPKIILLVVVFSLLGILGMSSYQAGLKYRLWSEWAVFLLLGPLLALGIQFSIGQDFDWQTIWIGCLTGFISVFYLHLKNFQQLMVNEQAEFQNTMTWLGFERGKLWLMGSLLLFLCGFLIYQSQVTDSVIWISLYSVACLAVLVIFFRSVQSLKSPLGSQMKKMVLRGHSSLLFLMSLWILQSLWSLWQTR
jgi:1,4-dihydroxy-2-naphthoate octaprenyltransferase